jgi:hypothetical protein
MCIHSRRWFSTGVFTGNLPRVAPSVLFGIFVKKSDSKFGTVHADVDAVEQARTCAGSSAAMLQGFESWLYSKIPGYTMVK